MNTFMSCCLCTFITLCSWGSVTFAQIVEIPDSNLKQAVREVLGLPDEIPLTQPEMLRLKKLDARDKQIADLTGLEFATNIVNLRLGNNKITSLTPLANLTSLTNINLGGNQIVDISPLANLVNLTGISFWNNPIEDITPLTNLVNLTSLNLANNQITDISPVTHLVNLKTLDFYDNDIVDLHPLANLIQLTKLRLTYNRIVDISPLANLTLLEELWIDGNSITDVSPLASLKNLMDLRLAGNSITDFSPLFELNLKDIDIDIHKLQESASVDVKIADPNLERAIREELSLPVETSLTQLVMNQLTRLDARDKQITDLTGLEHATNLTSLVLSENEIRDLNPLAGLINLEALYIWDSLISEMTPLENLDQLKVLNLAGGQISDLTPLANLTQLKTLHLQHNQISDITPLSNLTQLTHLTLTGNKIVNVRPLANLTRLEELKILHNLIIDYSPLDHLSLTLLERDEFCELPRPAIETRIKNRNFPSILGFGKLTNRPTLSREDQLAYHDLVWDITFLHHSLRWKKTAQGYQLAGNIKKAKATREVLLARNPNMLLIVEDRHRDAILHHHYPEDWEGWVRDENGDLVPASLHDGQNVFNHFLVDFTRPDVQDIIVQKAVAVAKCGLFDGIISEWWTEQGVNLAQWDDWSKQYSTPEAELQARLAIIQRIRAEVPDDFLIVVNVNRRKIPLTAPYINGGFMEIGQDYEGGYTHDGLIEIENTLRWLETNLRGPRINCVRGAGIKEQPPDSLTNKRWMRVFTTMTLTLSDGYALYTTGAWFHDHIWYDFWEADLGHPIGPKARQYQNVPGLFIREFTNGWAVYNRSGNTQEISLLENAIGVASDQTGRTHQLADWTVKSTLRLKISLMLTEMEL